MTLTQKKNELLKKLILDNLMTDEEVKKASSDKTLSYKDYCKAIVPLYLIPDFIAFDEVVEIVENEIRSKYDIYRASFVEMNKYSEEQ